MFSTASSPTDASNAPPAVVRHDALRRHENDDVPRHRRVLEPVRDLLGHEAVADVERRKHGQRRDESRLCHEPAAKLRPIRPLLVAARLSTLISCRHAYIDPASTSKGFGQMTGTALREFPTVRSLRLTLASGCFRLHGARTAVAAALAGTMRRHLPRTIGCRRRCPARRRRSPRRPC